MSEHEWEQVNVALSGSTTERLKIEDGWLYHVSIKGHDRLFHTTMCFVPDSPQLPLTDACHFCSIILSEEERQSIRNNEKDKSKICYSCWNKR
jgi:hypothetical protein